MNFDKSLSLNKLFKFLLLYPLFIIIFYIIGLVIGLKFKVIPSSIIFFSIFIGSLFGQGQGKVLWVLFFFMVGIYIANYLSKNYLIKNKYF